MSIFVFIIWLIFCGYTGVVAGSKGHDVTPWTVGGLLFGPIALLAAVGLPDLKTRKYLRLLADPEGDDKEGPKEKTSWRDIQEKTAERK
jgi:hypothetical protein